MQYRQPLLSALSLCCVSLAWSSPVAAQQVAFHEDFEAGLGLWTAEGLWHVEADTDPCASQAAPFPIGTRVARFGDSACQFEGNHLARLTLTNPVTIPGTWTEASLRYWSFEDAEFGGDWDVRRVLVSANGGQNWTVIDERDSFDWHVAGASLTAWIGQSIQLRFEFDTGDEQHNDGLGWMIDDLEIIDETFTAPDHYCWSFGNSFSSGARIDSTGSQSVTGNDMHLTIRGAVPNQLGVFVYGQVKTSIPFGDGYRCVAAGSLGAFRVGPPVQSDAFGEVDFALDFTQGSMGSGPGQIEPGDRWHFQYWYRDPGPSLEHFNLSNAVTVHFLP